MPRHRSDTATLHRLHEPDIVSKLTNHRVAARHVEHGIEVIVRLPRQRLLEPDALLLGIICRRP